RTQREPELRHQPGARFAPEGDADRGDERLQARAAPAAWGDEPGKAFGEDALGAGSILTEEAAGGEAELHRQPLPGQVGQRAPVATVHAGRDRATGRTGNASTFGGEFHLHGAISAGVELGDG